MKLIIAGSRSLSPTIDQIDQAIVDLEKLISRREFHSLMIFLDERYTIKIDAIVSGRARGSDRAGEAWATGRSIEIIPCPISDEEIVKHGKFLAPKFRNARMAEIGDAAIVFWDRVSNGSTDMIARMAMRDKPCLVIPMSRSKSK